MGNEFEGPWTVEAMVQHHQSMGWRLFKAGHPDPKHEDADLVLFRRLAAEGRGEVVVAVECGNCCGHLWTCAEQNLPDPIPTCRRCHGDGFEKEDPYKVFTFHMSDAWVAELHLATPQEILEELLATFAKSSRILLGPVGRAAMDKARADLATYKTAKGQGAKCECGAPVGAGSGACAACVEFGKASAT